MVPALNEELDLPPTIRSIQAAAAGRLSKYEIIIVDDGSRDRTGEIADRLAAESDNVRVVHHDVPCGLGFCYREGLRLAAFPHYMFIASDNQFPAEEIAKMFEHMGDADIVIHHVTNMHVRPFARRAISQGFTVLMNRLFGLDVAYFNGGVIHRVDLLRGVVQNSNGFAYQAEILVRLIHAGASYVEVGCEMVSRQRGKSSAFKIRNVLSVAHTIAGLYYELRLKGLPPVPPTVREALRRASIRPPPPEGKGKRGSVVPRA